MIFTAIGTAIAGALFAGSALAASVIAGGLAFGASLLISSLTRPKASRANSQPYSAVQGQVQYGADVPVGALYGTGKVKGHHVFYAKYGSGNKFNADVFLLSNGWCDGLEPSIYFYGQKYTLTARSIIGNEAAHYGVSGFGNLISIRFYDGRPGQGVDTKLVADTAALGNTWKASSVCAGLTYVVVEREYDAALFDKGRPDFDFILRGVREYDPRKDSTVVGGSGPHRLDDPSTREFSTNPAGHRLNYQLGLRGMISGRTLIGEGKSLGQLDLGSYVAAMNVCDTPRNGKPTYAASLYVTGDDDHTEVLKEFDDAMAGYALNRRGLSGVIPGAPQIPVLEITADDIPVARAQEMQRRKSAFDLYNYISGQFTSPESLWNPESLTPVTVNLDVMADGRPRQTSNDFLQVTDADIAQYLLNIRYRQNRKGGSVTLPVSRRVGFRVQEGEWVTFDGNEWLVTGWLCDAQARCTLQLAETGADVYSDEGILPGPIVVPPTAPVNPSLLSTVQDFNVAVGFIAAADEQEVPALQFTWTPPADPSMTAVRFFYFVGDDPDGQTIYQDTTTDVEAGTYTTTKNVVPGVHYTAQATITTVPDRLKTYTPWVTTETVTGPFELYGGLDLDALGEQIGGLLSWMGSNIRDLIEESRAQAVITGDQEFANAAQFDEMRHNLSTVVGKVSASFNETVTTAIIPMNGKLVAMADALTVLGAGDGNDLNTIRIRYTVQTGPGGGSVIGLNALQETPGGGVFRQVGLYLDVPNDPDIEPSILLDAKRIAFGDLSSGSSVNPLVYDDDVWRVNDLLVGSASIQDLAVVSAKIGDLAVTRAKIDNLAVGSAQIDDLSVTTGKIGYLAVDTLQLKDGAVTATISTAVPNGGVTPGSPATGSVTFGAYVAGSIQVSYQVQIPFKADVNPGNFVALTLYRNGALLRQDVVRTVSNGTTFDFPGGWYGPSFIDLPPGSGSMTYTAQLTTNYPFAGGIPYADFKIVGAYAKK